jgi:hypothetical protein
MIRLTLPFHLRNLAGVEGEVTLELDGAPGTTGPPLTQRAILDALEDRYPVLRGTIRDHASGGRRPFLRYIACGRDLSHEPPDAPLPEAVATGTEPFHVIGAIAGG